MVEIRLSAELRVAEWRRLPEEIRDVMREKIIDQTLKLYNKVRENLGGRILQIKSGQLLDSVEVRTGQRGRDYVGEVYIDPVTPKAQALEYGGKDFYAIYATEKPNLVFWWEREARWFVGPMVNHPPSKEFAYLRTALEEVNAEEGLTTVLDEAIQNTFGR